MVLSILAHFRFPDPRLHIVAEHLLGQQMPDGGWNCESYNGATHSSFHTTISVLEGLLAYTLAFPEQAGAARAAQADGREFLLAHRLYRSHRSGEVVSPAMTRFPFPPRWQYDALRGLDYFQACNAVRDERLEDPIGLAAQPSAKQTGAGQPTAVPAGGYTSRWNRRESQGGRTRYAPCACSAGGRAISLRWRLPPDGLPQRRRKILARSLHLQRRNHAPAALLSSLQRPLVTGARRLRQPRAPPSPPASAS